MHKAHPLVSVIIPIFNAEKFIEATVSSVLEQSYSNIEVILVDDGSSDGTFDIMTRVAAIDERVICQQMPSNSGGPAGPRNKGLDLAKGQFVAFVDDDDIWTKDKLEIQLSEMLRQGLNFSSSKARKVYESFNSAESLQATASSSELNYLSYEKLIRKNLIVTSSVVCERSLIGENRFSESPSHVAVEDYVLWLHLHQMADIKSAVLPQKLVYYRVRAGSISRSKLRMARKILSVLSEARPNGRKLGLKKWIYFANYIVSGLRNKTYE